MKKNLMLLFVIAFSSLTALQAQKTVSGVKLDNKISVNGTSFTLNGSGVREKMWIDLYVAALYLPTKSSDGDAIVNGTGAAVIKLDIVSGMITSEKLIAAINDGFETATNKNTAPIKSKIDSFKNILKEKISKGDTFIFANTPGEGVVVYKNGVKKGTIEGQDFKKALFGIWLSNNSVDAKLRSGMLGK